jgi:hypothetical protein
MLEGEKGILDHMVRQALVLHGVQADVVDVAALEILENDIQPEGRCQESEATSHVPHKNTHFSLGFLLCRARYLSSLMSELGEDMPWTQ